MYKLKEIVKCNNMKNFVSAFYVYKMVHEAFKNSWSFCVHPWFFCFSQGLRKLSGLALADTGRQV